MQPTPDFLAAQADAYVITGLTLSMHALERFSERFPGVDVVRELSRAVSNPRTLTKKRMNELKRGCKKHASRMKETRYIVSRDDAVFVVVNRVVVTAFLLGVK
jgi:hypothetical protein